MSECLVCFENVEQGLASMCAQCNNAFLCDPCRAQWRQSCLQRNKAVTCPKCRAILEQPARLSARILLPLALVHQALPTRISRGINITIVYACVALPLLFVLLVLTKLSVRALKRLLYGMSALGWLLASALSVYMALTTFPMNAR